MPTMYATSARLALSNTTDAPLMVTTRVDGIAPPPREPLTLTLAPHETRLFELPRDLNGHHGGTLSRVGGLSLAHTGTPGALLARAFIVQPETGFSSSVQFIDPGKSKSATLHGTGLRLGRVSGDELTPVIVARNIGDTEAVITGRIPYTTNDGSMSVLALPQFRLSAGETKQLPLAEALRSGHLPRNLKSAGLEFEYTGAPGSVVMAAQSMSSTGNQVFRVPLLDPMAQKSSTGGYPWSIDGDSATVVYIKNVTDREQKYALQLNYPGGTYTLGEQTVAAGQTAAHDLRALRDRQTRDLWGRAIPQDAASGQVHWSLRGPSRIVLIGRAEQADLSNGVSSSYACQNCCGDSFDSGWMDPGSVEGTVGDVTFFTAIEQDRSCYGSLLAPFTVNPSWESSNPAVAICDGGGMTTGVGPGSAIISGRWMVYQRVIAAESGGFEECTDEAINALAEALCDVLPAVNFTRATAKTRTSQETTAQFEGFGNVLTANLDDPDCPGSDRISVIVSFLVPNNTARLLPQPDTRVTLDRDNKYELISVSNPEYIESVDRGFIEFVVQRRSGTNAGGTSNKITVRIVGQFENGRSFFGMADVSSLQKVIW